MPTFIAVFTNLERVEVLVPTTRIKVKSDKQDLFWTLHVDGSSSEQGSIASFFLTTLDLDQVKQEYAVTLRF